MLAKETHQNPARFNLAWMRDIFGLQISRYLIRWDSLWPIHVKLPAILRAFLYCRKILLLSVYLNNMLKMNRPCLSRKHPDSTNRLNNTEPPYWSSQLVIYTRAPRLPAVVFTLRDKGWCETLLGALLLPAALHHLFHSFRGKWLMVSPSLSPTS